MKSELTIQNFNEIPLQEQQDLNGGVWPFFTAAALLIFNQVIADWDNFKNGLTGQPEQK